VVRLKAYSRWCLVILAGVLILASPLLVVLGGRQPVAQAASCWQAQITDQWTNTELVGSVLRVSVQGKVGLPVEVRSSGNFKTLNYTGTKPEYGPFVAEFAPLSRGTYLLEPQGLGIVFEVWLDGQNYTRVDFTPLPCAPTPTPLPSPTPRPPTVRHWPTPTPLPTVPPPPPQVPTPALGWQGRIVQRIESTNPEASYATIAVRVIGRPAGQQVEIRSGTWSNVRDTGTKPEHGPDACEFGALRPGTYTLTPKGLDTNLQVTVEWGDFVLVEFYQSAWAIPVTRWSGSVVENTSGEQPTDHVNSAVTVIVAGKPWHEVEIKTDGWNTMAETGYKPEYGPDACEFGGLRAGTYTIIPKGLGASVQVTMDGWGWAMVRFDETLVTVPQPVQPPAQPTRQADKPTALPAQPSPTATGPRWSGSVISNSSGEGEGSGIWSVIIVRVVNWAGVPVTINGGGVWSATCITGTKPEHGWDACEFGGLWPATYFLQPEGADIQVEVEMDGLGVAVVEFMAR
jgi:hypothetical protein